MGFVAAWDYSGWLHVYGQYLEERLECFRVLHYDVESERSAVGGEAGGEEREGMCCYLRGRGGEKGSGPDPFFVTYNRVDGCQSV